MAAAALRTAAKKSRWADTTQIKRWTNNARLLSQSHLFSSFPVRRFSSSPLPSSPSPSAAHSSSFPAPSVCCGCGSPFQSTHEALPGFIEAHSLSKHMEKLADAAVGQSGGTARAPSEISEQRRKEVEELLSGVDDASPLLNSGEISEEEFLAVRPSDLLDSRGLKAALDQARLPVLPDEAQLPPALAVKPIRCVRCFQLSHYGFARGQVRNVVSDDFAGLLRSRFFEKGGRSCVILYVVDIADFHGSFIKELSNIVGGRNPIMLVANKVDLLPFDYGESRIQAWIKAEAARYGLTFQSVQIISALTGKGVGLMWRKARELSMANERIGRRDLYVVGATNAGKSSVIQQLIQLNYIRPTGQFEAVNIKIEPTDANHDNENTPPQSDVPVSSPSPSPSLTPSPLSSFHVSGGSSTRSLMPGTTLGLLAFPLIPSVNGTLFDTPGVVNAHQLANHYNFDEMRCVFPRGAIKPLGLRLSEGQSIIIGGLARVDLIAGRPFFLTVFVSDYVSVHVANTDKLEAEQGQGMRKYYEQHVGVLLAPPFSMERFDRLGLLAADQFVFDLTGRGWRDSSDDIVMPGLGWISVTGAGSVRLRVQMANAGVPAIRPVVREPLMPFESRTHMKRFNGNSERMTRRQIAELQEKIKQRAIKMADKTNEDKRRTPLPVASSSSPGRRPNGRRKKAKANATSEKAMEE